MYFNRFAGLSPLARGTRQAFYMGDGAQRFIPAGAGNTHYGHKTGILFTVYPRWRGEHPLTCNEERPMTGLSPLARGTHVPLPAIPAQSRFIPAGAGNTARRRQTPRRATVYPRWRGEHYLQL
ncbi:hypothetical protein EAXG_03546 [Escherichia coli TA054]|nr:hypothetical protein EAXG_03546 [Escherichia coli TA054]